MIIFDSFCGYDLPKKLKACADECSSLASEMDRTARRLSDCGDEDAGARSFIVAQSSFCGFQRLRIILLKDFMRRTSLL